MACILAEKKAMDAYSRSKKNWVLGADTIVVLQETILGKPLDYEEARSMLTLLSGRKHEVITGFSIINPSGKAVHTEHVSTIVTIKNLSEREITAYIGTGEPFGKAGSYAIQGKGAFMVKEIAGSYSNVVGLPVYQVIEALLALGALDVFPMA
jgi:septum formation protein